MAKDNKDSGRKQIARVGGIPSEVADRLNELGYSYGHTVLDATGKPIFSRDRENFISLDKTVDGVWYLRAKNQDGREGYSRQDGSDAFGGLHFYIHPGFEYVNGKPYSRAMDLEGELEREGLFDEQGLLLSGKNYDKIVRYKTGLVQGDVFAVKEGKEKGFLLGDCSLFGKQMLEADDVEIKKFAGEACFHGNRQGEEIYVGEDGQDLYGGWACELREFLVGSDNSGQKIIHGIVKNKEGNFQIRARNGNALYGRAHDAFDERRIAHDLGFLLEAYDKDSSVILDENGMNHYGMYHFDPGRKGFLMNVVDGELLLRFPAEEADKHNIVYWKDDNTHAFGGPHEEELPIEDGLMLTVGQSAETVKGFRDKNKVGYFSRTGIPLFEGYHDREAHSFPWHGDFYKCFYDEGKGYCYRDMAGIAKFGGYHPKVGNVKMITFEKDGEKQHAAFLEVLEPVPVLSLRRLGNFARFKFGLPITYYSFDGQRFDSLEEIQKNYQVSADVSFQKLRRSDSVMLKAVKPEDIKKDGDEPFLPPKS